MNRYLSVLLIVAAVVIAGGAGLAAGRSNYPLPDLYYQFR